MRTQPHTAPDSESDEPPARPVIAPPLHRVFDSHKLLHCPNPACRQPLPGIVAGVGVVYVQCRAKLFLRRPGDDGRVRVIRDRCGQHILVHGSPNGRCLTVPLSPQEYHELTERHPHYALTAYPPQESTPDATESPDTDARTA